jgi:hypothetical protein
MIPPNLERLEQQFHEEMIEIYQRAKAECRYVANRFLQMVSELGGLAAAKRLLASEGYQEGFTRLCMEGRLDLSMEATILKEPWRQLFSADELRIAKDRLDQVGYPC